MSSSIHKRKQKILFIFELQMDKEIQAEITDRQKKLTDIHNKHRKYKRTEKTDREIRWNRKDRKTIDRYLEVRICVTLYKTIKNG